MTLQKNALEFAIGISLILITGVVLGLMQKPVAAHADSSYPLTFAKTSTSTIETVTTNTVVLATSTARLWATISNNSANPILCTFNGNPAVNNGGQLIVASSTLTINQNGLYTGAVNCIAQGTATIWVEAVQ